MALWIQNAILLCTLIAVALYTLETKKIRLQAIRPKLVFLTPPHVPEHMQDTAQLDFILRNVGAGTAINIRVEQVTDESFKLAFEPEHIRVLERGEQQQLAMHPAEGNYKPSMNLILDDQRVAVKMIVRYLDVEGNEFRTSTQIGGGAKPPFIRDESI